MKSFSRFLKENPTRDRGVVITFGRYNPPTIGHEVVFNLAAKAANERSYALKVFMSHTNDRKKNPLTYEQKIDFVKRLFPRYSNYVTESPAKTIIQVVQSLEEDFDHLVLIVGEDRVDEFQKLFNKYNGSEFNFDSMKVISAGRRDPDSEGVEGMSASKMRALAAEGNFNDFAAGLPASTDRKLATELYSAVRSGMGIQESGSNLELDRSLTREKFYAGDLVQKGEAVIIQKTQEEGTVSHIGSNYVIVETAKGKKRCWASDVTRKEEQGAGEEGTDKLVKRYKKDTPGQSTVERTAALLKKR